MRDLDHDAVIRIGGAVPGGRPILSRTAWKPCLPRVTAASDHGERSQRNDVVAGPPSLA
jgi:hypothetical protein